MYTYHKNFIQNFTYNISYFVLTFPNQTEKNMYMYVIRNIYMCTYMYIQYIYTRALWIFTYILSFVELIIDRKCVKWTTLIT